MVTSIKRLGAHLGNKGKFRKASALFRRLLEGGQLDRSHGKHVMEVRERPPVRREAVTCTRPSGSGEQTP